MIDWTTCPFCNQPLRVQRVSPVIEYMGIGFALTEEGELQGVQWGESDYYDADDWSPYLACRNCNTQLPDEYSDAIYEALCDALDEEEVSPAH